MILNDAPSASQALTDEETETNLLLEAVRSGRLPLDLNGLQAADFTDPRRLLLFRAMLQMQAAGQAVGRDALIDWLRADPEGMHYPYWGQYLSAADRGPGQVPGSLAWAKHIHDLGRRRRMLRDAEDAQRQALDVARPLPPEELPAGSGPIVVRSAADALTPRPPPEWIVENLVSRGSLSIFYGEPGSKKTYSMLWLAACAARGAAWLGLPTRLCRVLFVDEESGETRLGRRLAQVLHGALGDASTPVHYVSLVGLRLNEPRDAARFSALVEQEQAELVIVDSLAAVTSGDENSKQEVQPVMTALRHIAERTGAALLLVHHSGKNGVYRGSSAYKASTDVLVHVTSEDGSPYVNFKTEKNRDGRSMSWSAKATWTDNEDPGETQFYMEAVQQQQKPEKSLAPARQFVLDYLGENGETALVQLVQAGLEAGLGSGKALRNAVSNLAQERLVHRVNGGDKGRNVRAVYALGGACERPALAAQLFDALCPAP